MNIIKALGKRETILFEFMEECRKQKANLEVNFIYYYDWHKKQKSEYLANQYKRLFCGLLSNYEYMKKERRKFENGNFDFFEDYGECISCLSELTLGDADSWDMDIKGDKINITLNYEICGYINETFNFIGDEVNIDSICVGNKCHFALSEVSSSDRYKYIHEIH